ncbi:MAG: hypothetical protein IIT64_07900 [Bacteroidaceae bacterium]|nr:hypothetical protein [Bacteroidaceae bacterium]
MVGLAHTNRDHLREHTDRFAVHSGDNRRENLGVDTHKGCEERLVVLEERELLLEVLEGFGGLHTVVSASNLCRIQEVFLLELLVQSGILCAIDEAVGLLRDLEGRVKVIGCTSRVIKRDSTTHTDDVFTLGCRIVDREDILRNRVKSQFCHSCVLLYYAATLTFFATTST